MEKLLTKNDLLNKLRLYTETPDDETIRYKIKIEDCLKRCPELLYALNEKSLESELFDEDGNINWEYNEEIGQLEPLGEWDRYFGNTSNIRNTLVFPETQTEVKNYVCYQVGFDSFPNSSPNGFEKYSLITFTIFVNENNIIDRLTGIPRHDLISSILREKFNWSSIFGMQAVLISSKETTTDRHYVVRTLVFRVKDINGAAYTPYGEKTRLRNNNYWQ